MPMQIRFATDLSADEYVRRRAWKDARLEASQSPQDLVLPGLNLHPLKGVFKGYWAVSVSENWRVIFRFEDNNAVDVNYLDYH